MDFCALVGRVRLSFACSVCPAGRGAHSEISRMHPISGIHWLAVVDGLYGVQSLGLSITATHLPVTTSTRLYRVLRALVCMASHALSWKVFLLIIRTWMAKTQRQAPGD